MSLMNQSPFSLQYFNSTEPRMKVYLDFLAFVYEDMKREREVSNRRMGLVVMWCFVIPAVVSLIALTLVRIGVFDRSGVLIYEWSMVAFPLIYLMVTLVKDFLMDIGGGMRRGGLWQTLNRFATEAEWGLSVRQKLHQDLSQDPIVWKWVAMQYQNDLKRMRIRAGHLTLLASSVFFIIMNGLDWIATERDFWAPGFFQPDWMQVIGLAVFLLLLSLSSSQVAFSLARYGSVARMLGEEKSVSDAAASAGTAASTLSASPAGATSS